MLGFSFLVFIINLFMKISNITSVSSFTPPEKPLLTFMILLFVFFFLDTLSLARSSGDRASGL